MCSSNCTCRTIKALANPMPPRLYIDKDVLAFELRRIAVRRDDLKRLACREDTVSIGRASCNLPGKLDRHYSVTEQTNKP